MITTLYNRFVSEVNFFFCWKMLKIRNSYIELPKHLGTLQKLHFPQQRSQNAYVETVFGFIVFYSVLLFFGLRNLISLTKLRSQHSGLKPLSCTPYMRAGAMHRRKTRGAKATFMASPAGLQPPTETLNTPGLKPPSWPEHPGLKPPQKH